MSESENVQSAKKRVRKRKRKRSSTFKSIPKKRKPTTGDTQVPIQSVKGVFTCSFCQKVFTGVFAGSSAWNAFSNHVRSCKLKKNTEEALLAGEELPLKDMVLGITTFGASNYETTREKICKLGGRVSNSIHKRVAFVIGTPEAIAQNTQRVRKACKYKIPIVTPSFLQDVEKAGSVVSADKHRLTPQPQKKKKKKSKKVTKPKPPDDQKSVKPEEPMKCYCICHDPDCPPEIEIPCPYCVNCGG